MFALVDCNSFYASCERLFRPDLRGAPIAVLSNNDGCVIALCDRAKAVGVRMGQPFHQIQSWAQAAGVQFFSSNYTLYGDLSRRVMSLLAAQVPALEVYSIDEAFLDLRGMKENWLQWAAQLKAEILRKVGMPTCVGIARTKALAKAANRVAKKFKDRTGGVWILDSPELEQKCLRWLEVGDIWGIGPRHGDRLRALGVRTAWDYIQLPESWVRSNLSIVGLRLQKELQGQSCLPLELVATAQQSICTSRSFGQMQDSLAGLEAAVASYATQCALKLRRQNLCTTQLTVFLHTNPFRPELPQRSQHGLEKLLVPSQDSLEIVHQCLTLLRRIWSPGYHYKKAGVILSALVPQTQVQGSFFDPIDRDRAQRHMKAWDLLQAKYGKGALRLGVESVAEHWPLRRQMLSPAYTTRWDELPEFPC